MSHFTSFVRIPVLALRQRLRPLPQLGVLEADVLRMRVWPNDIDFNFHMNNARYLSAMDYGRVHLLARAGLLDEILNARWRLLVGAVWVTYRRPLPLLAPFTLSSRLVCWDTRWFYIEQTFTGQDGVAALGWVKGAIRDAQGTVDPHIVLARVTPGITSPLLPEQFLVWNELTREKLQAGGGI